jgi:hypothetical protein
MTDIRSDGAKKIIAQQQVCDQSLAQRRQEPALRRGRYRRDVNPRESHPNPRARKAAESAQPYNRSLCDACIGHSSTCSFTDTTTEQRFLLGHPVNEERGTQKRIDSGWDDNYG